MAVFFDSVGTGGYFAEPVLSIGAIEMLWTHTAPAGRQVAVVAGLSYWVYNGDLVNLTRNVWYGITPMQSLGVKAWTSGAGSGWTELFGLINPPKGKQLVHGEILGGFPFVGKLGRANTVSYTGVDGFGAVTNSSGTASGTQSLSATGASATKIVAAYGTNNVGLNSFSKDQRYLSNTYCTLLLGDTDGSGSSTTFAASRGVAGPWGALSVVLNAADITGTATGVSASPVLHATGRRYARPGTNRRSVFSAEPES